MTNLINNYYNELIIFMTFICAIGITIMIIPLLINRKKKRLEKYKTLELTDKDLKKEDEKIEKEQLIKEIFNLYKKVEIAKSKFDYDTLKEVLTDTLYKEEKRKLEYLKNNKQKIVATNIKLQEIKILSINRKNEVELINIYLHVSKYDYVIDNKKKVVRGTDEIEYQVEYKITLEKNKDNHFIINKKECTGKWIKNK